MVNDEANLPHMPHFKNHVTSNKDNAGQLPM